MANKKNWQPRQVPRHLPQQQDERSIAHLSVEASFSGPLPHPSILKQYDDVVPGLAANLATMMHDEQKHRHALNNELLSHQRLIVESRIRMGYLGMVFSASIFASLMGMTTYLVSKGQTLPAIGSLLGALTVVGGSLYGYFRKKFDAPSGG